MPFLMFVIFHNTKCAHMEVCPLYTAEWEKRKLQDSMYNMNQLKRLCMQFIHTYILYSKQGKRGFLFYISLHYFKFFYEGHLLFWHFFLKSNEDLVHMVWEESWGRL